MRVVKASWEDHKEICALARLSPFSKGFVDVRFVQEYYQKGWILVTRTRGAVSGFICVRHLVRKAYSSVYYMGVATKRSGVGSVLLSEVGEQSPWRCVKLISEKANVEGLAFYKALGFYVEGEGANKQGEPFWRLTLDLGGKK